MLFTETQYWSTEIGLHLAPKTIAIKLQTYLAKGQSKKRRGISSFAEEKLHLLSPCQFLLHKLSLVKMALFCTQSHKHFNFQGKFCLPDSFMRVIYLRAAQMVVHRLYSKSTRFLPYPPGSSFSFDKGHPNRMSLNLLWFVWSISFNHLLDRWSVDPCISPLWCSIYSLFANQSKM